MSFQGLFVDPTSGPRDAVPPGRGEKGVLAEYLDRYRMSFELKCEGLSAEQLATRSVPPSTLSLLGLIRHLALVEHHWTRHVFEGHTELPWLYHNPDDPDSEFTEAVADAMVVTEAWETWRAEVKHSQEIYQTLDLNASVQVHGKPIEARDVVVHLIEEYARHVGHADLLRECLDGRTGQ